jgi:CheY-like chemotaxis protein
MATTYSIIKNHHGYINVESTPGLGTTFSFYLPAAEDVTVQEPVPHADFLPELKQQGSVLILDDEAPIRDLLGSMLTELGFTVEFAENGNIAIQKYKKAKEQNQAYQLLVLDLTVPGGIGGKEVIQELRAFDPAINAIVSSGYSNDPIMAQYKTYGFKAVLKKPYQINELTQAISKALS